MLVSPVNPVQSSGSSVPVVHMNAATQEEKLPPDKQEKAKSNNSEENKDKKNLPIILKVARATARYAFIEPVRWVGILAAVSLALIKTPGAYKVAHDISGAFNNHATANRQLSNDEARFIGGLQVDSFASGYEGINNVIEASNSENINGDELDLNKNNYVLDTSSELISLRNRLATIDSVKYADVINLLNRIDRDLWIIWGPNGPGQHDGNQGWRLNCPIMSDIQTHTLTPELIQELKEKIRVVNFREVNSRLLFDTEVNLNGQNIFIPYEELERWMSPREIIPSHAYNGTLYIPILTYAVDHLIRQHEGDTIRWLPSSTATVFTGETYRTIPTIALSESELIHILSQVPQEPTKIVILHTRWESLSLDDIRRDLRELEDFHGRNTEYSQSDFKANEFQQRIQVLAQINRAQNGNSSANTESNQNLERITNPPTPTLTREEDIITNHVYTVRDFSNINGEWVTIIIDAHGREIRLPFNKLKAYTFAVVSRDENIPFIGQSGLVAILVLGGGIFLILRPLANKGIKLMYPAYENKVNKFSKRLIRRALLRPLKLAT